MATWAQGTASPAQADVMASFSSRGPLGDWIKPDVTAPGVQVLAGTTPQPDQTTADNGPPGNLYHGDRGHLDVEPALRRCLGARQGGAPGWTPAEIKSALMTSSVQSVVKEDGVTPAGRVRHGCRLDPRRPRGQPDARVQRDVRALRRRGQRHAAPHRPEHPEHRRDDDDRVRSRRRARRSTSPAKNQTLDVADHAAGGRHDHRQQRQARLQRRQGRAA